MTAQRTQRFPTHKSVILRRLPNRGTCAATAINISNSGLLIQTTETLAIGEQIDVHLICEQNGQEVSIDGTCEVTRETLHPSQTRYGLRFINKFVHPIQKATFKPLALPLQRSKQMRILL